MSDKKLTYSKQVIEIADFLFANPDKSISGVISVFCVKYRKTSRTIETYIAKAREYNRNRIQKQEKIRDKVLITEAKESIKSVILSRNQRLEILSDLAIKAKREENKIKAIAELNKMQGDYAPEKIENMLNFSDPFAEMRKNHGIN